MEGERIMTNQNNLHTVSELVEDALGDYQVYINTIAGHEDEPAMVGYAEFGVPWHSASCQERTGLKDIGVYRAQVGTVSCSAWMDNTTIVTACALMSEKGAEIMTPLTVWDLATFMRAAVCYERIYHHAHPDIDDAQINRWLGTDLLVSVPLPTRYAEHILPDPWDGAHRFMCDTWFSSIGWLKRLHEAVGKGTLDGTQLQAVTNAWRAALGCRDLEASDLVDFEGVDRRWRSPSNQLLIDTANITTRDETIVSLDPDEGIQRVFRARREAGLQDSSREMRSHVLSDLNLRGYINQRIAEFFTLPYACSAARLPFRSHLYDRSLRIQQELTVAKLIDNRYAELAQTVQLRLPVFLAVALRSSTTPESLWDSIAELRDQGATFREHREEMDRTLARGDLKKAEEISRALHTSVGSLLKVAGTATTSASGVVLERIAKGDIAPVSTAISVGVAAAKGIFKSSFTDRLMWRLRKPELLWINNLVDQAHHLTEAMPDFSRMWEIPPNRQAVFAERFQKMAVLAS
jgi:hypothetical protein